MRRRLGDLHEQGLVLDDAFCHLDEPEVPFAPRIGYDDGYGRYKSIDSGGTGKPQAVSGRIRVGDDLLITSGRTVGFWPVSPDGKWIALFTGQGTLSISHLDGSHRRLVSGKICCAFWAGGVEWAGK